MNKPQGIASFSLDLDNQWAYLRTHGDNTWKSFPSFLDIVAPRISTFFAEFPHKPTIFVVGKDLDSTDGRSAVKMFADEGFELGNHSENHRADFHNLTTGEIRYEVACCEEKITALTNQSIFGFRGPSFQISDGIADVLVERGYRYDASSYPTSIGPLARAYHFCTSQLSAEEKDSQRHLFGHFGNAFASLERYAWPNKQPTLMDWLEAPGLFGVLRCSH